MEVIAVGFQGDNLDPDELRSFPHGSPKVFKSALGDDVPPVFYYENEVSMQKRNGMSFPAIVLSKCHFNHFVFQGIGQYRGCENCQIISVSDLSDKGTGGGIPPNLRLLPIGV
jgi:hypothetical protein